MYRKQNHSRTNTITISINKEGVFLTRTKLLNFDRDLGGGGACTQASPPHLHQPYDLNLGQ